MPQSPPLPRSTCCAVRARRASFKSSTSQRTACMQSSSTARLCCRSLRGSGPSELGGGDGAECESTPFICARLVLRLSSTCCTAAAAGRPTARMHKSSSKTDAFERQPRALIQTRYAMGTECAYSLHEGACGNSKLKTLKKSRTTNTALVITGSRHTRQLTLSP